MTTEGYCQCGCGQRTSLAPQTNTARGLVRGKPMKYLPHHQNTRVQPSEDPNPNGLCMCGCGGAAPVAERTRAVRGVFKGHHLRYIHGHHARKYESFYEVDADTGCWNWRGAMNSAGYGMVHDERTSTVAHRVMYEELVGPVPDGLELDHLCMNRACVNPEHLEPVTRAENIRRGREAKKRRLALEVLT